MAKEQIALAVEKERIQEESDQLLIREDETISEEQRALQNLQEHRDQQIEELKTDREELQVIQKTFMETVVEQIRVK